MTLSPTHVFQLAPHLGRLLLLGLVDARRQCFQLLLHKLSVSGADVVHLGQELVVLLRAGEVRPSALFTSGAGSPDQGFVSYALDVLPLLVPRRLGWVILLVFWDCGTGLLRTGADDLVLDLLFLFRLGVGCSLLLLCKLGLELAQLFEGSRGGGVRVLPPLQLEIAGGDVGLEDGDLEVEVVGADGNGLVVLGDGGVVLARAEKSIRFGLVCVGLVQKFLWGMISSGQPRHVQKRPVEGPNIFSCTHCLFLRREPHRLGLLRSSALACIVLGVWFLDVLGRFCTISLARHLDRPTPRSREDKSAYKKSNRSEEG